VPGDTPGQTITAVERTALVLSAFAQADNQTLGVTEISNHLEISKAVVHRILNTLRSQGYIAIDPTTRRYMLGPATLELGLAFLRHVDVRDIAKPMLEELSAKTRETATISIRSGAHRLYIDQVTPSREVKMTVVLGRSFPLHAGGSSKAILAHLGAEEIDAYISDVGLDSLTESTITDPGRLLEDLAHIRDLGYASSVGERQVGAASVAAPVFDHSGGPVAAISLCGPAERFRDEADEAASLIVAAGRQLSERMGYQT
jgi:IclR family acetate operon transcriptional repressor